MLKYELEHIVNKMIEDSRNYSIFYERMSEIMAVFDSYDNYYDRAMKTYCSNNKVEPKDISAQNAK